MSSITCWDLPSNMYILIFSSGIFIFLLSLVFCCYFVRRLRLQTQSERSGFRMVELKDEATRSGIKEQRCAVCLEEFQLKDELGVLPCGHAFHKRCLVKWLEVRHVCPLCNTSTTTPPSLEPSDSLGYLLDELGLY